MTLILSILLFLLLTKIGKERGMKTFFTFYLSIGLMILYVFLMNFEWNALIVSIGICILASALCLFMINGINTKTISSFISIIIVLIIVFLLVCIIGYQSSIQGFSEESMEAIGIYMLDINYSMTEVWIGMYLVCIIGTITDTSISISSSMNEVLENNPKIKEKELFQSGMNIGKDILSTTMNTLYFAVISSFIGFFMWHDTTNLLDLLNYKTFFQDITELFFAFIGSILIIPVTSLISSKKLLKESNRIKEK